MYEIKNVGSRSAVLLYKGQIVATLRCDSEIEATEDYAAKTEVVIQGLSIERPDSAWRTIRDASTPSRGPAPRYKGEPTVEQVAEELVAEEQYQDGERAAWRLENGDRVPTEGSEAFLDGLRAALERRKQGGWYSQTTFSVVKGVARIKPIKQEVQS